MVTLEQYFKLLVFNYVISNGDAHLKNFSLIRNELRKLNLSPTYDLMITILPTPGEGDTAIGLFDKDYDSAYNLIYGHYGRMEFIELARRLGLVELRYLRILNEFIAKRESIIQFIDNSLLSNKAKEIFLKNLFDKLSRIK
jgi:serine/threonine-protein kinase HipA